MKGIQQLVAAGLAMCLAGVLHAAPVTIAFTGSVTQTPNIDPAGTLGGAIDVGTSITGHYTFDAAAVDGAADAHTGSYDAIGAPYSIFIAFGSPAVFSVGFDALNIGIGNDFGGLDFYTLAAPATAPAGGLGVSLVLIDIDGSAFGSDALPAGAPVPGDFESRQLLLVGTFVDDNGQATQIEILGTIDTLDCSAGCSVPAPAPLALLGAGLAALAACRRKPTAAAPRALRSTPLEEAP